MCAMERDGVVLRIGGIEDSRSISEFLGKKLWDEDGVDATPSPALHRGAAVRVGRRFPRYGGTSSEGVQRDYCMVAGVVGGTGGIGVVGTPGVGGGDSVPGAGGVAGVAGVACAGAGRLLCLLVALCRLWVLSRILLPGTGLPLLSSWSDWSDCWPGSARLLTWLPVWFTLVVDWACTQAPPTVIREADSKRTAVFMVRIPVVIDR